MYSSELHAHLRNPAGDEGGTAEPARPKLKKRPRKAAAKKKDLPHKEKSPHPWRATTGKMAKAKAKVKARAKATLVRNHSN